LAIAVLIAAGVWLFQTTSKRDTSINVVAKAPAPPTAVPVPEPKAKPVPTPEPKPKPKQTSPKPKQKIAKQQKPEKFQPLPRKRVEQAPAPARQAAPVGRAKPAPDAGIAKTAKAASTPVVVPVAPLGGCPKGMVKVPGGSFIFGSRLNDPMRGFGDLNPSKRSLKAYCVDAWEYPNTPGSSPKVGVTWPQARSLCAQAGKRLCSEQEWERACKGSANSRFPTSGRPDQGACNVSSDGRAGAAKTIGTNKACRSGFGVMDLAGNVAEWTASRWSADHPDRVTKGGAANQAYYTARCSARANQAHNSKGGELGLRCCLDIE